MLRLIQTSLKTEVPTMREEVSQVIGKTFGVLPHDGGHYHIFYRMRCLRICLRSGRR
jgi:hypothetical protein